MTGSNIIATTYYNKLIYKDYLNNDEKAPTIVELRDELKNYIKELIEGENKISDKAFIFFIDDLDRLKSEIAVNLLEVFKNIFDITNCIFVLAIDYEVVVKGLKSKFGDKTEENEREYRSFLKKLYNCLFLFL